ncbi:MULTISPECIES: hypothetical protein [Paracoccus]|uniref:Uncharacterized protein n=1 Tax=Paracoccus versutus TaxID=34007 RepID=A0A3D9XIU5_PARVE|nr:MULTISPECIES: hypothetical protein [Paracoccus]MBT0778456.1 hypothetical protein [Paracoccus sp. pheM1]REF70350.1 hypothetical protein BDD41_3081 [Paracoccus versutus]WGR57338.1 hypothetical protein E3U25_15160 [Paracoccus versutus]
MVDFDEAGKPRIPMRGMIDPNGLPDADRARAALATMRRRAQRGDPEAALHILNHIVPDIPPDEEARS